MSSPIAGPERPSSPLRSSILFLSLVLMSSLLIGCGGEEVSETEPDIYSVRGIVRQVPTESGAGTELFIHHEAIPEFRDEDGEMVGMDAMAMPFPLASDTPVGDLAAGDRIQFSFEVRWRAQGNPLQLTAWERLDEEVLLEFEHPLESSETSEEAKDESTETSPEEEDPDGSPATS